MSAPWNYDLYINGEWTEGEGGGKIDVIDPATEETIGSVATSSFDPQPTFMIPRGRGGPPESDDQVSCDEAVPTCA